MTRSPSTSPNRSRRPLRRAGRYAVIAGIAFLVIATALIVAARLYLPTLLSRKGEIEAWLTNTVHHPVHLGRIESYWRGLNPGVRVYGVTVYGSDARRAGVRIGEVQVSVEPLALLRGQLEVYRVVLIRPSLTLERGSDGRIGVVELTLPSEPPTDAGFAALFAMPRMEVRDGEMRWRDVRAPADTLTVSNVDISLRNSGDRHRFQASADFPDHICRECALTADVSANPESRAFSGELSLRASGLDVKALPLALRERLPANVRGRFDVDLWSEWHDSRPSVVRGRAAVSRLRFPFGAAPQTVSLRELSANVQWRQADTGWQLELDGLTLGLINAPWSAGRLRLEYANERSVLQIDHVNLDDVTRFVTTNQTQHPLLRYWADVRPTGALDALRIESQGPFAAPTDYDVKAQLVRLGTAKHERLPSVSGLSGSVDFDSRHGSMDIDAKDFWIYLPRVFREPLGAARAKGMVKWRKTEEAWQIDGSSLQVQDKDGKGSGKFKLDIPHDRSRSPVLTLRVDFRDGNGANAALYYPVHELPPKVLQWMESSFVDGQITSGYVEYDGPIRAWPFDEGQGKFQLRAKVRDAVYRYLPGWAPITQGEVSVAVDGANALITGDGRMGLLRVHDVRVEVGRRSDAKTRFVRVRGQLDGPVSEALAVLQSAQTKKDYAWRTPIRAIASASGTGALDLDVLIPLNPKIADTFFATYRVQNAAFKLADGGGVEALNGVARFTDAGLHDSSLKGDLFGGPATLVSSYQSDGLHVRASGRFRPAELLRSRRELAERVSGSVDWSLDWKDGPEGAKLRANADYSDLRLRFPAPLNRHTGSSTDRLSVVTSISRPDAMVLTVESESEIGGKLAFDRANDRWRFNRGRLSFGQPAGGLPPREGLEIGANVDAVDADQWLPLIDSSGQGDLIASISGVRADVKHLSLLNRDWGRSFLNFARQDDEWRIVVDGDSAAGEGSVMLRKNQPVRANFDLAYLRLPPASGESEKDRPTDPRNLPAVKLRAGVFEYKQRPLGELDFSAAPDSEGWRIDRLRLKRPELALAIDGVWRKRGSREGSQFNVNWESEDMGTTLDAFGLTDQMAKGKVKLKANLAWPGAPTEPELAGMNGSVEVSAENGRFLKLDPGAARLFGLFDLRSIARYLTFDFSPAFGKGFAFDAIHGNIAINRGNARTDNLVVTGPALSLGIVGRVGLAAEDYDLAIEASPRIGSTLTLTSWGLFGPQVAAAVLALQSLFKHQISEGTQITYLIKGSWDNPKVTKVAKETPPPSNEPTQ